MAFATIEELSLFMGKQWMNGMKFDQIAKMVFEEEGKTDRTTDIKLKIGQAYDLLLEAQEMSKDVDYPFEWDLAYGMGGYLEKGEWHSSTSDCQ